MSRTEEITERVVIAVHPHKASGTAAAVTASLQPVATLRVPVNAASYQQLRRFADRWRRRVGRSEAPVGWVPR